jgi:hypothetical protein
MNPIDYQTDLMVSSCEHCIPDITDWWHQEEERGSKYADVSNVAHNLFSITPGGVEMGVTVSVGPYIICER